MGGLPICSWANHTDGAFYKTAPRTPARVWLIFPGPFSKTGRGGGPGRATPASVRLSTGEGSGWGVEGEPQLELCSRWALGGMLPPTSRPLQGLFLWPGVPFPLGVTG